MKISGKKKDFAAALSAVEVLSTTLTTDGKPPESVDILVSSKGCHIQYLSGVATIRQVIPKANIEDVGNGGCRVMLDSLKRLMSASGDTLTLTLPEKAKNLQFAIGKAKGVVPLAALAPEEDAFESLRPKTTISLSKFSHLLKSTTIKDSKAADRTLHFDATMKTVSVEATDDYRALVTSATAADDSKFPGTTSLTAASKVLKVIADLTKGENVMFGFDKNCITVRTPGFYCCIPQQSTPPLTLGADIDAHVGASGPLLSKLVVDLKSLKGAYDDVVPLSDDKDMGKIVIETFGTDEAVMSTESNNGAVTSPFALLAPADPVRFSMASSYIKDALANFDTKVEISVYGEIALITAPELTDGHQLALLPLLDRSVAGVQRKVSKAEAEPAVAAEKPKKAKKAEPAPAPAPVPVAAPADDEEEDEAPAPPTPPAPKKKAPEPAPAVVEDDEEATAVADDEDFDDDE